MVAVLQRVPLALAQGGEPIRCPTCNCDTTQLPILWARFHPSGVVGPNVPASFATFAAYGDFATGVLAIAALLTAKIRPLFWFFVVAFNLTGATDIIVDYFHAIQTGLDVMPGQFGATYAIPIIYVPLLMITHVTAFYLLLRSK
jgi:hypothetical protein